MAENKFIQFFQPGKRFQRYETKIDELIGKYKKSIEVQELLAQKISDLEEESDMSRYKGNAYNSYTKAVKEIEKKYLATADWGVVLTGNIIDLRSAFIIGNGLQIRTTVPKKEAETELKWINDFMAYNKLDRELVQELAKEAEIEGKIAIKLAVEDAKDWRGYKKMVSIRFISWLDRQYEIESAENDYLNYEYLVWKPGGKKQRATDEKLEAAEFVYNKFGGRIVDPNSAQPKIMKCLTQVDDVDKALRDWREINWHFASPIPDVEADDKEAAEDAEAYLKKINWRIKKGFIHAKSRFSYKGPDMAGVESLKEEIITKIKIISGTTAIPIHFLGLLDLLKNRSTGENTREMVIAGTSKERMIWVGTYAEIIEKAIDLFNEANKKKSTRLESQRLSVGIPIYTAEQWEHIEKVLIPLYLGGAISIEYLLSQIPEMDVDEELERQQQKKEDESESLKAQIESLKEELAMAKSGGIGEEEIPAV